MGRPRETVQLIKACWDLWRMLGFPLLKQMIEVRRLVKEGVEAWKVHGFQVDRAEQADRFVRLAKATGSFLKEVELRRIEEGLRPLDRHIKPRPRKAGKAR